MPQASTDRAGRVHILLETLLRAVLKGIPGLGASLDQITFGLEDRLAAKKLRSDLDELLTLVRKQAATVSVDAQSEAVSTAAKDILTSSPAESLLSGFQSLESELRLSIDECIRSIEIRLPDLERNAERIRSLARELDDSPWVLQTEGLSGPFQEEFGRLDERLQRIEALLSSPKRTRRALAELVEELSKLHNSSLVEAASITAGVFENLATEQGNRLYALDTHELLVYAVAPVHRTPQAFWLTHLMQEGDDVELVLLPETLQELGNFIAANRNALVDFHRSLHSFGGHRSLNHLSQAQLSMVASMSGSRDSPFVRLMRALKGGRIKPYFPNLELDKEYREVVATLWKFLMHSRPKKEQANLVDALSLAQIALLNLRGVESIAFVSGSPLMARAVAFDTSLNHRLRAAGVIPVMHPQRASMEPYLSATKQDFCKGFRAALETSRLTTLVSDLMGYARSADYGPLASMADVIRGIRANVVAFGDFLSPYHERLISAANRDWGGGGLRRPMKEELAVVIAHELTCDVLDELLAWLEPLEEILEPFQKLAEELLHSEAVDP